RTKSKKTSTASRSASNAKAVARRTNFSSYRYSQIIKTAGARQRTTSRIPCTTPDSSLQRGEKSNRKSVNGIFIVANREFLFSANDSACHPQFRAQQADHAHHEPPPKLLGVQLDGQR